MRYRVAATLFLLFLLCVLFVQLVGAHDHDHPELNEWLMGLENQRGSSCCNGSDAFSIDTPDWDANHESTSDEYPYKVFVRAPQVPEGRWEYVPKSAVVKQANKYGIARVWPQFNLNANGTYAIRIQCFLPGSFS